MTFYFNDLLFVSVYRVLTTHLSFSSSVSLAFFVVSLCPISSSACVYLSVYTGTLLLQLTGHRDLVTSIEMRAIPTGRQGQGGVQKEGEKVAEVPVTATGAVATDMLVSVSDDHTARVFYFTGTDLLN